MEYKALVHDPLICTGCQRCATTCSTYHNGATSLTKARIQIARHEGHAVTRIDEEDELMFEALHCQQCDKPYCALFCPVSAISRNKETGAMEINYDKCIGCRMCMAGCPFGAMRYDTVRNKVFKCNLCDGDPQCVKFCPMEAIKFLPKTAANTPKIDYLSKKIMSTRPGATQQIHAGDIRNGNS